MQSYYTSKLFLFFNFRSVADRFGVSKSTCWATLYKTCEQILEVNTRFKVIAWPSRERTESISVGFRALNGFEGKYFL